MGRDERSHGAEYTAIRERVAQLEQSGVLGARPREYPLVPLAMGRQLNAPPHVVYEEIQAQDMEWVGQSLSHTTVWILLCPASRLCR